MEHIRSTSGLTLVVDLPTTIFEDNTACIEQLKKGYIKGDNTKHIAPKFFYSHQQQQHQNIEVKQIRSQDNLADSGGSTVGSMGSHDPLEVMETTLEIHWSYWYDPLELLVRPLGCTPSVRRKPVHHILYRSTLTLLRQTIL
ncbi:hypothetical protein ACFX15_025249 [Malus domestica]